MQLESTNNQNNMQYPYGATDDIEEQRIRTDKLVDANFFERKGFVVKVFSLISFQLLITFLFCSITYSSQTYQNLLSVDGQLTGFSILNFTLSIITEIMIFCCRNLSRRVPHNYILMALFTFSFSNVIAANCAFAFQEFENGGLLVLISALMTFCATVSLTIYAVKTKNDITMMGGSLWLLSLTLFLGLFLCLFSSGLIGYVLISMGLTVLYGFYLIYDIQLILGGKHQELSIDDYVIGAMIVYIDIVILFLRILKILLILFGKKK